MTIQEETDVVVVGGGTAGTVAAIQAGRCGVRTTVVEMHGKLGGTTTVGGVNNIGYFHTGGEQVTAGIGWELICETYQLAGRKRPPYTKPPTIRGVVRPSRYTLVDLNLYPALAEDAALAVGVVLHYHEIVTGIERQDDMWCVTAVGKGGLARQILAREVIDCTGDADLVGMLDLPREREEQRQPGTLEFRLAGYDWKTLDEEAIEARYEQAIAAGALRPGDFAQHGAEKFLLFLRAGGWNKLHLPQAESTTSATQTDANIAGRQALLRLFRFVKSLPGCEEAQLAWTAESTAIRETFRIIGETRVTEEDYRSGRVFDDAIGCSIFFIDIHEDTGHGVSEFLEPGVVPTIPLGALVPKGTRNLLVAGRTISSDRAANSALRIQPACMVMGQGAAAAAALGVKHGVPSRDVSIGELQQLLCEHGAILR